VESVIAFIRVNEANILPIAAGKTAEPARQFMEWLEPDYAMRYQQLSGCSFGIKKPASNQSGAGFPVFITFTNKL